MTFLDTISSIDNIDICFLDRSTIKSCIQNITKHSIVISLLYRLHICKLLDEDLLEHESYNLYCFIDQHIPLVRYIKNNFIISDEELQSETEFVERIKNTNAYDYYKPSPIFVQKISRCPNLGSMLSFLAFGSMIKGKLDSIYTTISHCLLYKLLNQKCTNRNLIPMLQRMFKDYPFFRIYCRILLLIFLIGNYETASTQAAFNVRLHLYDLFSEQMMSNDEFDNWMSENNYLVELLLREHQIYIIERSLVYDVHFNVLNGGTDNTYKNNWLFIKRSTRFQCDCVRKLLLTHFNDNPLNVVAVLLQQNHTKDLNYTLKNMTNKSHLDQMIDRLQQQTQIVDFDELYKEQYVDSIEKWLFALKYYMMKTNNVMDRLIYFDMPPKYLAPETRCCDYSSFKYCVDCAKTYLSFLTTYNHLLTNTEIYLDSETFKDQIMTFRKKNNLLPWEPMRVPWLQIYYSEIDENIYFVSSIYKGKKRNRIPTASYALKKCSFNIDINEIVYQKDKKTSLPLKSVMVLGRIFSTKNKRWIVCSTCGVIIQFHAYCFSSEGLGCPNHNKLIEPTPLPTHDNNFQSIVDLYEYTANVSIKEDDTIRDKFEDLIDDPYAEDVVDEVLMFGSITQENEEQSKKKQPSVKKRKNYTVESVNNMVFCEKEEYNELLKEHYIQEIKDDFSETSIEPKKNVVEHKKQVATCFFCNKNGTKKHPLIQFTAYADESMTLKEFNICEEHSSFVFSMINSKYQTYSLKDFIEAITKRGMRKKLKLNKFADKYL